jgi:hypothetical protein
MLLKQVIMFLSVVCVMSNANGGSQVTDAPDDVKKYGVFNNTESKAGEYTLPEALKLPDGTAVTDAKTWYEKARPRIVKLFEENEYGRAPGRPADMTFDVFDKGTPALDGKATRKQVTIYFTKDKEGPRMDLLIYLPAAAKEPVPLLLNISFVPNNRAVDDPNVKVGRIWDAKEKKRMPATGEARPFGRLHVQPFIDAGFGIATFNYADVDPDALGSLAGGIRAVYLKPGQKQPAADEWGAIAAWAWGMSRAMDYFETDKAIDAKRVAITGISRLGKTVMWAGAHDQRFAMVIASCSGEGGAALSRRNYGETIAALVDPNRYPYQFCANYAKYAGKANELPMDSHMLIALVAPRALLLQTGNTDRWSDPYGEWLAAVAAGPVYKLLEAEDLGTDKMPPAGEPILRTLGYYMHDGGHGTLPGDWDIFVKYMAMHLKQRK